MVLDLQSEPGSNRVNDWINVLRRHLERDKFSEHFPRRLRKNTSLPLHPALGDPDACFLHCLSNPIRLSALKAPGLNNTGML
jgi:hypothetical protein